MAWVLLKSEFFRDRIFGPARIVTKRKQSGANGSSALTRGHKIANPISFMKAHQLTAAIAKAETQLARAQTNFKAASALAASLKNKIREAKDRFKEARRAYKQLRRSGRVATREKKSAAQQFEDASAALKKLQGKRTEAKPKAP